MLAVYLSKTLMNSKNETKKIVQQNEIKKMLNLYEIANCSNFWTIWLFQFVESFQDHGTVPNMQIGRRNQIAN